MRPENGGSGTGEPVRGREFACFISYSSAQWLSLFLRRLCFSRPLRSNVAWKERVPCLKAAFFGLNSSVSLRDGIVTQPAKILKPAILSVIQLYSVSYKRLRLLPWKWKPPSPRTLPPLPVTYLPQHQVTPMLEIPRGGPFAGKKRLLIIGSECLVLER